MSRLITGLLITFLVFVLISPVNAQWEKEVGKVLFKNGIFPSAAGPGKVAFLRIDPNIPDQPMELYVGDIITKAETRALPGVNFTQMPSMAYAWSPDGKEFVVQQKSAGCWNLFRFKTGIRVGEKLTDFAQYRDKTSPEMLNSLNMSEDMILYVDGVSYSPSGKKLIFTLNRPAKGAVWWHDLQTGKSRQATEDQCGYYGSFHPNDDLFCYTEPLPKEGNRTDEDLLLRSIATGVIDTLCHTPAMEFSGVISPDGKYVVYVKTINNSNNLYVINIASKESRQLTSAPAGKNCTSPNWSPDGRLIVFQGSGFFGQPAVFARDFTPF